MRTLLVLTLLTATVLSGCTDDGEGPNEVEGINGVDGTDGADQGGEGAGRDPTPEPFDEQPEDCTRATPVLPADPTWLATGAPRRTLDLVVAVDSAFRTVHEDWRATVDDLVARADHVWQNDLDLEVRLVAVVELPDGVPDVPAPTDPVGSNIDGAGALEVHTQVRAHFDEHHPDLARDLVHTFLGESKVNGIVGHANCVGGARYKDAAYTWSELTTPYDHDLPRDLDVPGLDVFLHEMGHMLGAHHHYGTCGDEAARSGVDRLRHACTLMFPYETGLTLRGLHASTATRLAIWGYAASVDL